MAYYLEPSEDYSYPTISKARMAAMRYLKKNPQTDHISLYSYADRAYFTSADENITYNHGMYLTNVKKGRIYHTYIIKKDGHLGQRWR